jgi:hypothetical protein
VEGQLALDLDTPPEEEPEPLPTYIPAHRLIPLVRAWLDADERRNLRVLAHATGIGVDTLRKLMRGETTVTRFATADRIVTHLNPWLWHMPAPGLADLYASPFYDAGRAPTRAVESKPSRKAAPAAMQRPEARPREVTP